MMDELFLDETPEQIAADVAVWDALWEREDAQRLLDKLVDEAREDIRAGKTTPILIREDELSDQ